MIEFDGDTLNDPTSISIIVSSFICFFVYTPLGLYYGYKFYLNHSHIIFSKRYSIITIYEILLMSIKIIWVPIEHLSGYYTKPNSLIHQLVLLGNIICAYFVLYCWVWRQWLNHYDIVLTAVIVNNQWRMYIDPEFEESQQWSTKWYLENKSTFGNYKWTRNRICIIAIICCIITFVALFCAAMIPSWKDDQKMWFYMALVCLIPYFSPMVLLIIIYKKTPVFDDNYYIQQELRYIFISLSVMYSTYLLTFIYLATFPPSNQTVVILILSIESNIVIFCQFCCLMIATYWVNKKMEEVINSNSYEKVSKSYLSNTSTNTQSMTSMTQSLLNDPGLELVHVQPTRDNANSVHSNASSLLLSDQESEITLFDVLSHIKSFELYMVHLSREFSLECLLSLIEFIEYQQLILQLINLDEANHNEIQDIKGNKYRASNKLWCNIINLPETLPKSAIVYGDAKGSNRLENCRIKAWALYTKYIMESADFEINIPGEMRSKYNRLMKHYDEWVNENHAYDMNKLLLLFDPLIEQMIGLMTDSFRRFQTTNEFTKLTGLILLN